MWYRGLPLRKIWRGFIAPVLVTILLLAAALTVLWGVPAAVIFLTLRHAGVL